MTNEEIAKALAEIDNLKSMIQQTNQSITKQKAP